MRQIQYKLPNVILTDIPERQLRKDTDVKVKIAYAAVCGSDIHDVSGDFDNTFMREAFWRAIISAMKPAAMWRSLVKTLSAKA